MTYVKDCFGENIRVGDGATHQCTPTRAEIIEAGLRKDNAALRARVEKLEARITVLKADIAQHEQERIEDAGKIWDLEAFKARVMAWARGRCTVCGTLNKATECRTCVRGRQPGKVDKWTPPREWEAALAVTEVE